MVSFKTNIDYSEELRVIDEIASVIGAYRSVRLEEIESVKLLNRVDTKYWFSVSKLPEILSELLFHYEVLEIEGSRIQNYHTEYFDTPGDDFYLDHHNGRSNRIKIRKRAYSDTGIHFLEIKRKSNKGRTLKTRTSTDALNCGLEGQDAEFLREHTNVCPTVLEQKICNRFKRITLINREGCERCTIDFELQFDDGRRQEELEQITIVELKQQSISSRSRLGEVLKTHQIRGTRFSKYCMGRAIMHPELKRNRLKPTLLKLKQIS
ncbi:MAG: polyphosphate polymerase domain-containing protein [Opitutales bacterium]|nr:polyphosphate polymerase domain-containing protein [Opitutales bacterium]